MEDSTSTSGTSSSGKSEKRNGPGSVSDNGSEDSLAEKVDSSHKESDNSVTGLSKKFGDDLDNVAKAEVELWERSTPHHQKLANNMVTPQKLKAKMQLIHGTRGKLEAFNGYALAPRSTKTKRRLVVGANPVKTEDTDDYDGYESNAGYRLAIGPSSMLYVTFDP